MGRLEDIIERNQNPYKDRRKLAFGFRGVLILLILGLLLFTNHGLSPDDPRVSGKQPAGSADTGSAGSADATPKDKRVHDVGLRRAPQHR